MTVKPVKYVRKPFYIDAVQVTVDNIKDVAEWCDGEVRLEETIVGSRKLVVVDKYVKVRVHRPLNDRQTKAYIGDLVLFAGSGFKVYTEKAFNNSFDRVLAAELKRMEKAKAKEDLEAKAIRDEKFKQIELTEQIEELMTVKEA